MSNIFTVKSAEIIGTSRNKLAPISVKEGDTIPGGYQRSHRFQVINVRLLGDPRPGTLHGCHRGWLQHYEMDLQEAR